jgi:hypothetical protein
MRKPVKCAANCAVGMLAHSTKVVCSCKDEVESCKHGVCVRARVHVCVFFFMVRKGLFLFWYSGFIPQQGLCVCVWDTDRLPPCQALALYLAEWVHTYLCVSNF